MKAKIGFVITAIRKDGLRHMAQPNQGERYIYKSAWMATQMIDQIKEINSEKLIAETMGTDLQVRQVELYDSGDAKRTIFEH